MVKQSRLNDHAVAAYELPLDSTVLQLASNGSLTDLLRKHGLGHVRAYGPGGLASPSFRGTGSSHTAVLWNGINLVSPLSGQLDLSLLPAGLFDDASIQTGGSTSISGNGSIGATIHLNNNLSFNEELKASISSHAGSFGSFYHDAGLHISSQRWGSSTKIFRNESANDFRFKVKGASQRRVHSAFGQYGLLQQLYHRVSDHSILSLRLWCQKSEYEVPDIASSQNDAMAKEENTFYRTLAGWNYHHKNFELNYQGSFVRQELNYDDPRIDLASRNRYNNIIQNAEGNLFIGDHTQLTGGLNYSWEEGVADNFGNSRNPSRNRIALFSALRLEPLSKWTLALSVREELVNGKTTPLAPGISARHRILKSLDVFTNLYRNYRLPTFNDLYWIGAGARGNPTLKAELSLGGETGISISKQDFTFKAVVFTNNVDNWISWIPLWMPGQGEVWTPRNIKKVWARGLEGQARFQKNFAFFSASLTGVYSYTRSTNESIYDNGNPNERGKQLVLTPVHEASGTVQLSYKRYWIRIGHSFTGDQFTDTDNTVYNILPFYNITNVFAGREFSWSGYWRTSVSFEINNLFDVNYQSRPGYPMPGINFKASLKISFNKSINHEQQVQN